MTGEYECMQCADSRPGIHATGGAVPGSGVQCRDCGRYQDKQRTGLIALVSTGYSRYVDM